MKIKFKNSNHLDDDTIWSNVKMGDEKAFSHLFEKHYAHLIRYGNSLSPLKDKVQDCVQEVFTDIWIYRESISESIVVKAYLLSSVRKRIARQQERDRFFGKTTSIDTIEFLLDFSIEHDLIADETTANKVFNLNKLLNELPSRQKEALYLRYHQGLSVDEIASTLDVNYQSANNLLYRAVLNLRKDWKDIILLFLAVTTSLL